VSADEAALHEAVCEEIGEPHRVVHVRLPAGQAAPRIVMQPLLDQHGDPIELLA
jgi:hypothetical protein